MAGKNAANCSLDSYGRLSGPIFAEFIGPRSGAVGATIIEKLIGPNSTKSVLSVTTMDRTSLSPAILAAEREGWVRVHQLGSAPCGLA